jgi:NitT/TauT family transport system substrate-binding protein
MKAGVKSKFFLFANDGYPPHGTAIVAMNRMVQDKPDMVGRFVQASMEGWKSYMADPAPGNVLIREENSNMKDDHLAYAIGKDEGMRLHWRRVCGHHGHRRDDRCALEEDR